MSDIYHWFEAMHQGTISDWAVALGTLALACATFGVARAAVKTLKQNKLLVEATQKLVESNKMLIENEERHHQENLRPLCVFDHPGNLLNAIEKESLNGKLCVKIDSDVENRGYGVAKSVNIVIRLEEPLWEGRLALGPIASMGRYFNRVNRQKGDYFPVDLNQYKGDAEQIPGFPTDIDWVLYLEYEDIFNNRFYTAYVHSKIGSSTDIYFDDGQLPPIESDKYLAMIPNMDL